LGYDEQYQHTSVHCATHSLKTCFGKEYIIQKQDGVKHMVEKEQKTVKKKFYDRTGMLAHVIALYWVCGTVDPGCQSGIYVKA
jgi:hypothetical protein